MGGETTSPRASLDGPTRSARPGPYAPSARPGCRGLRHSRKWASAMSAQGTGQPSLTAGSEDLSFAEFIRRVRGGDERAARELVWRYEPAIRRAVRVRLRDPRLRRLIESVDICQSVFASCFVRTALGQYDLKRPDQLLRLLATIARNKLACHANRERADRRDQRRIKPEALLEDFPAPGSSPSREVAARELVQEARKRMTTEERALLERR